MVLKVSTYFIIIISNVHTDQPFALLRIRSIVLSDFSIRIVTRHGFGRCESTTRETETKNVWYQNPSFDFFFYIFFLPMNFWSALHLSITFFLTYYCYIDSLIRCITKASWTGWGPSESWHKVTASNDRHNGREFYNHFQAGKRQIAFNRDGIMFYTSH